MDLTAYNRRASQRGQRRLDDATPEDEHDVEHVVDAEPDYETQTADRAERRAMRGQP